MVGRRGVGGRGGGSWGPAGGASLRDSSGGLHLLTAGSAHRSSDQVRGLEEEAAPGSYLQSSHLGQGLGFCPCCHEGGTATCRSHVVRSRSGLTLPPNADPTCRVRIAYERGRGPASVLCCASTSAALCPSQAGRRAWGSLGTGPEPQRADSRDEGVLAL